MARFEVFIPAATPEDMNMTLRVTADTWMAALKVGLKKIGDNSGLPQNVLCDIQDDESIHVTDPRNNRVFRIATIPEVSNPGVGVILPTPNWMAAPSDPVPPSDEALREMARVAAERAEQEKAARARAHAEKEAAEKAAAERAAADRLAAEKAAAEKAAAEKAHQEQLAAERAAAEKKVADLTAMLAQAQADKTAAEARAAKDSGAHAAAKALEEKAAQEKAAADRAAAEKAAAERAAQEKAAQSRAAAQKAATDKAAADKAAADKAAVDKAAAEKAAAEKALADRASADKARADKDVSAALKAPMPIPVKIVEVDNQRSPPPAVIGRLSKTPNVSESNKLEEILADLFERTPEMFGKSQADALYFMLDLAMEKIPSESGSFYVADLNRRDLGFAAVRGPKASELLALKLRVPMGKGLVGFCAQEGVAVAISDAQRDRRFFKEISQRLGYETKSMITTPVIYENRTLGAIQLINKSGSTTFNAAELSVLHYLAHQAAIFLEAQDAAK